jgi:FemAB-related protein (PEP-CTERM system-associated)
MSALDEISLGNESVSALEPGSSTEWDNYVDQHAAGTLYHGSAWQRIIERAFGKQTIRLVARQGTAIRGVLPLIEQNNLLLGRNLLSMPYSNYGGPLADSPAIAEALASRALDYAFQRGARTLELRDFVPAEYEGLLQRTDKVMMRLELPASLDALARAVGAKVRSQVRRPEREGAVVQSGGVELLGQFYAVFRRNMRDLGTPVYPRHFFEVLFEELGEKARILVVMIGNNPVAAAVLIFHRGIMEIPWAASIREYNRLGVNMRLYWEAFQHSYERGASVFDFGRSTEGEGTYRFKKQWGAEPHPLKWHRNQLAATAADGSGTSTSERAVRLWQKLPLPVANWLGPRISPDIPW